MAAGQRISTFLGAAALGLVLGACKENQPEIQTLTLAGTVEKIDLANHKVQIRFYSEKHGRNLTQEADVTDRTEVFINGIAARLEDVKEGEGAEGQVIVTGKGDERVISISKVYINRASAVAASQPSAGPPVPAAPAGPSTPG